MYDKLFVDELSRLQCERTPYCTVTIVDAKGSIPQVVGASAVFGHEGLLFGTIGGGRVELRCAEEVRAMLSTREDGKTRLERLNLHRDIGMTCAGELTLYYEVHHPEDSWDIVIFGAGHVAQKLCRFLIELECHTICVDTRPEWLARLPQNTRLELYHATNFSDGVDAVRDGTFVIIMTMGHDTDVPILDALARRQIKLPYLGVIGSKSKAVIMRRHLKQIGLSQNFIDGILCPMGDKIGDNTPGEIAVGMLAQLVRRRRQPSTFGIVMPSINIEKHVEHA